MPFDGLALSVVCQELRSLLNSRVMKIYQPEKHTIVIHLRSPGETNSLLISADPNYPRIHTTNTDLKNPSAPPAFCMLLRKYLEPGRVLSIEQDGLERVLNINFECFDEDIGRTERRLVFELMGRHSNILLLDANGRILDAAIRKSNQDGRRLLVPGEAYTNPDDQGKVNPYETSKEQFLEDLRLSSPNITLPQWIQDRFQGFSRLGASEVINRANLSTSAKKGETSEADWNRLWMAWHEFLKTILNGGEPSLFLKPKADFAAYKVSGRESISYSTLNSLLDDFFTQRVHNEKIQQAKNKLKRALSTHLDRLQKKEEIHRETIAQGEHADELQRMGELITANMYQIKRGEGEVQVIDYYDPKQKQITIELDPSLSPSENAQRYFKRYSKIKKGKEFAREQLKNTLEERMYLEEVLTHIELADEVDTLEEIEQELERTGYIKPKITRKKQKNKPTGRGPYEFVSSDGLVILLGKNNKQNDELTLGIARPNDLWFHAQKIPGSHVIVRADSSIPDTTIEEAATLAARYSKASSSPKVPVDYTKKKHVKKPGGSKPGFVIYDNFQTILVDPTETGKMPKKRRP